ncbi:MAG: branched-chain amino acid ABC transporter permease [Candidatus Kaiserbacteria bacterium]|nr:branched-chain amino acid ABC transporter permease [Candidatus Kaiserbacteria bacterium]
MEYFLHLITLFAIYAILGLSLNLVVGYTGLLSATHAAFYGIGAYATALLLTVSGLNFFFAVFLGIILTSLIALSIGSVLSKFRDDYYALGSIGFCIITFSIFLNWQDLTRGPLGISGIPRPDIFGLSFSSSILFALLALIALGVTFLACRGIVRSSFGRVLKAIREDEGAIQVFGYRTHTYKLLVFVISAAMASVAGSLFATYVTYIDPSTFTILESVFILAIIILGGLANLRGSLIGALILILIPELLRFAGFPAEIAGQTRELVYGLMLLVLMLRRPQGLLGEYKL